MIVSAIDLGSGTIKFSAFEEKGGAWQPLILEEINSELRKGMGPDLLLQPGPIAETLAAVEVFVKQGKALGLEKIPAYGTSALRKARNREVLFGPLKERFGIDAVLLSEIEEGRLNLLGAVGAGRWPAREQPVVVDPGGDSTDCAWAFDSAASGGALRPGSWQDAQTASLPFGSVSLQERFGHEKPGDSIPKAALEALKAFVKGELDAFAPAAVLRRSGLLPAIRMNAPVARALAAFAGREKQRYELDDLRALTLGMAAMPHEARAQLIAGEPVGKVDRTPFGFASWVALLEWMDAGTFVIEPYGIKLGAALFLGNAWQK
jgi:exopolyphosphatase/pppGpp-phosphohydrolase